MKKILLITFFLLSLSHLLAQTEPELSPEEKAKREKNIQAGNPFKRFGYTPKIATLSKGKYLEFHDLDSVVRIGSFSYHVKNREIVGYTAYDTIYPESTLRPELMSRWISPDPLSEEFPNWSPYVYTNNNPIRFIDPTGMATEDCCPDLVKGLKGVYGSVKSEVVGTYDFVTSDAYKSETWKGMGNLIVGVAALGTSGNIVNAYEVDAILGTNSVGALQGMAASMESYGKDLTSGDIEKTAGAITTAALFLAPTKLDDVAKVGKLGKIDFIVTPDGVSVPLNQKVMREGFDNAGFPSTVTNKTNEKGVIHTVPTNNGKVDVRTMEGSTNHPKRAVITHPNTNSPKSPSGKGTTNKKDNHIEQH